MFFKVFQFKDGVVFVTKEICSDTMSPKIGMRYVSDEGLSLDGEHSYQPDVAGYRDRDDDFDAFDASNAAGFVQMVRFEAGLCLMELNDNGN